MKYKIGDKITLSCSEEEFKNNVLCGAFILEENFKDGIAEIIDVDEENNIQVKEVVWCSGDGTISKSELKYIKKLTSTQELPEQGKLDNQIENLEEFLSENSHKMGSLDLAKMLIENGYIVEPK